MKEIIFMLLLIGSFTSVFAQQIHSNFEILKIMNDSELSYLVKTIDTTIACPDYSENLNNHSFFQVTTDSGVHLQQFAPNEAANNLFEKAEDFYHSKKFDSALFYYSLTIEADSSLTNVMTYIGQIYENKGDNGNAVIWYKKAISKNYIDYMAHWFLADYYHSINDLENAINEISIALILNRNNSLIRKSFLSIFRNADRITEDWCFNPQVKLSKISESQISVVSTTKWIGYSFAKALWTYEPNYPESMGVLNGNYSTLEDKECLIALLMGLENAKIDYSNDAQLRILKEAAENKHLDDYILFEIGLRENPIVAFHLPQERIESIKDYIISIRNKK